MTRVASFGRGVRVTSQKTSAAKITATAEAPIINAFRFDGGGNFGSGTSGGLSATGSGLTCGTSLTADFRSIAVVPLGAGATGGPKIIVASVPALATCKAGIGVASASSSRSRNSVDWRYEAGLE